MTNGRYSLTLKKKNMKNTIKKVLIVAVIMSISLSSFAGGPWLQKKNHGFVQMQTVLPAYRYSSMLMGTFIKDVQGVNRKTFNSDYGIYIEYGLMDDLNVITRLPFKYVSTGDLTDEQSFEDLLPSGSLSGMSNYELALKYKLIDKKVKVAVSLNSSWNTISQDLNKGLATGYDANSLGLTAHIGRSSNKQYGFLEVGFHKYSNNFSDAVKISLEHGWQVKERLNVGFALDALHFLENGSYYNANLAQTGLYPNNQGYMAIGGKLAYEKENGLGFNVAVPLIPIKFKYIGFNGAFALGVYKKI